MKKISALGYQEIFKMRFRWNIRCTIGATKGEIGLVGKATQCFVSIFLSYSK
jgi:hypothetical protein